MQQEQDPQGVSISPEYWRLEFELPERQAAPPEAEAADEPAREGSGNELGLLDDVVCQVVDHVEAALERVLFRLHMAW